MKINNSDEYEFKNKPQYIKEVEKINKQKEKKIDPRDVFNKKPKNTKSKGTYRKYKE